MGLAAASTVPGAPSGAAVRAGEWWLSEMGIEKAWSVTKGSGVTVGLLDSGVDPSHPDLQGALVPGKDFSGLGAANGEKPVGAGSEHGTTMAGFIVGRGHGGAGLLGVAPEAKVMSASFNLNNSSASAGLRWLVDHGAKVINMSFGGDSPTVSDIAYAESHDVVLVAGTGNGEGTPPDSPANRFGVVSVSGVEKGLKNLARGSSYGFPVVDKGSTNVTEQLQGTAVAGPFETTQGNNDLVSLTTVAKGSYELTGGTSNATAIVSGIVALIRAAHPDMNAANVINRLIRTASLGKANRVSAQVGFGVPDAYAAVTSKTVPTVCENPLGSQATKSPGIWPSTVSSVAYTPACSAKPTSSASGTSGAPSSAAASGPVSSAPSQAASSGGRSSGGVPAWVYVLIAVAVLAAIGVALALRSRGKRGGPGGPPQGGYGSPPGGPAQGGPYGPPQGGSYGPPPTQGGWRSPPPQGGWPPGS